VEGTVPLKLYYSPERNDYFTTVTQAAEEAAVGSGYQLIRIDGYVFSMQMEGTVPLNLYYSYDQNDNLMTATQAGNDAATQAGYQFIRTEGYICP
jgi:hypothetical protein